jgi:hypothetical protein
MGYLLDGLAFGPMPAVIGLDEELRTIKRENLGGVKRPTTAVNSR